jgi:mono/diheme cytochrome c family protein
MRRRFAMFAVFALAPVSLAAYAFGGWAVITVESVPEYLTAGQPVEIAYIVRQHGMTLLPGLRGSVVVTDGHTQITATPTPAPISGRYVASLTVPHAGNWTVSIQSGFMNANVSLAPIHAIATGARPPAPLDAPERGLHLFAAKGCVTCHVHAAVAGSGVIKVGPDLTPKRYQADFLARFLADPSIQRTPGNQNTMPNLGLKPAEIAALVAFINTDRPVAASQSKKN